MLHREWTESRGRSTKQTWINDWRIYTVEYTGERIERNHPREPTSPKRMDDGDPWASQPWRTRSSSTQWLRSSTKSMKRTSWGSLTGSVLGEGSTKRWMRSG